VLRRLLEEWPQIKAPRATEVLREYGYAGSVDVVRRLHELGPATVRAAQRTGYRPGQVLQRLEQTAERARAEQWPYEQFLETLLEAAWIVRRLERYHLLVVDEVGYLPLERQAANLLFALVSRR
jgi:hypothetical protein